MKCEFCGSDWHSERILKAHQDICQKNPASQTMYKRLLKLTFDELEKTGFEGVAEVVFQTNILEYYAYCFYKNSTLNVITNVCTLNGEPINVKDYFDNFTYDLNNLIEIYKHENRSY